MLSSLLVQKKVFAMAIVFCQSIGQYCNKEHTIVMNYVARMDGWMDAAFSNLVLEAHSSVCFRAIK